MLHLLNRENLRKGLRNPVVAFRAVRALIRGSYYRFYFRLCGVRLQVGRNFRCYGRLVVAGPGRIVIGDDVVIRRNLRHTFLGVRVRDATITIGDLVWLHGTSISCRTRVDVGERSLLGRVDIIDHEFHDPRDMSASAPVKSVPVRIGSRCWIGNDSLILKGVEIGERTVLGARTVARRSLPPRVVVIGNPAAIVKELEEAPSLDAIPGLGVK